MIGCRVQSWVARVRVAIRWVTVWSCPLSDMLIIRSTTGLEEPLPVEPEDVAGGPPGVPPQAVNANDAGSIHIIVVRRITEMVITDSVRRPSWRLMARRRRKI